MVLLSCWFLQIIPAFPYGISGLYYIELLAEFDRGPYLTSWIISLQGSLIVLLCKSDLLSNPSNQCNPITRVYLVINPSSKIGRDNSNQLLSLLLSR